MALTDSLIEYWELEEASGNRTGSHQSLVLTDTNTVAQGAGLVGNCADFERDNNETLQATDETNYGLSTDTPFTWACWINLEAVPAGNFAFILSKIQQSGNFPTAYSIWYDFENVRFRFAVHIDNTPTGTVCNFSQSISVATWYFLVCWHNPTDDTLNIQFNNGTPESVSHAIGTAALTGPLVIGGEGGGTSSWDGLIDQVGFWKRVLTSDERTELYNSGAGLSYASLAGGSAPAPTPSFRGWSLRPNAFAPGLAR